MLRKILAILVVLGAGDAATARPTMDFDGDGRDDLVTYQAESGTWTILKSSDGQTRREAFGGPTYRPVLGDFDGDGRADLAIFSMTDCTFRWVRSSDGGRRTRAIGAYAQPVCADFNGDHVTDLAVYDRTRGRWTLENTVSGSRATFNLGWHTMMAIPGDYDGDGRADAAAYRKGNGAWVVRSASSGVIQAIPLGHRNARPVPADYDGDGKDDPAVFERSTGNWYVRTSGDGQVHQWNWGGRATRPVPGDYDGDGRDDLAVFDPAASRWLIQESQSGALRNVVFGGAGSVPLAMYRDGGIAGYFILAFGDSITYGSSSRSDGPETGYPQLLEFAAAPVIGGHVTVINGGNPGETTSGGLQRLPAWLQAYEPDLVLLMEGTNDTFFDVPAGSTLANLLAMAQFARGYGAGVVIGSVPPVINSYTRDRSQQAALIRALNPSIYPQVVMPANGRLAPVYEAMTSVAGWESSRMDPVTGNHPNDAGYRVVRNAFLYQVQRGAEGGLFY